MFLNPVTRRIQQGTGMEIQSLNNPITQNGSLHQNQNNASISISSTPPTNNATLVLNPSNTNQSLGNSDSVTGSTNTAFNR